MISVKHKKALHLTLEHHINYQGGAFCNYVVLTKTKGIALAN